jgi:hypothetical protein
LTESPVPDRDESLAKLAVRYLAPHGPASPPDLAAYAGITLADARRSFALGADSAGPGSDGLQELPGHDQAAELPPPRLLGMFDPVLHGWADRSFITDGHGDVVTSNGMFRAVALVDGRAAGVWALPGGMVTLTPLRPLAPPVLAALEAEALDVLRFLGLPPHPMRVNATGVRDEG